MGQFAKFKWTLFALLSAVVLFAYLVSNYLLHLKNTGNFRMSRNMQNTGSKTVNEAMALVCDCCS